MVSGGTGNIPERGRMLGSERMLKAAGEGHQGEAASGSRLPKPELGWQVWADISSSDLCPIFTAPVSSFLNRCLSALKNGAPKLTGSHSSLLCSH